jgi:hypothetical protein
MSEGGPIAAAAAVEVVGVEGRAVVVRDVPSPPNPIEPDGPAVPLVSDSSPQEPPPRLSSVLEEFDFDALQPKEEASDSLDSPPPANQS